MSQQLPATLTLINDVLQAAIVVFGVAVVLYNLRHSLRDRVTRAFNALLFFVVVVFFGELLVSQSLSPQSTEIYLRLEWIGIAMVPAAQYHLADALLVTTGNLSRTRRLFVRVWYLTGVALFALAIFSDLFVSGLIPSELAPHLQAGPFFLIFSIYYWTVSAISILNVWRARERCVTRTTRKRMTMILVAFFAAPLSVFPYLVPSTDPGLGVSALFWSVLIVGNLVISTLFALLTYYIAYFGATSPDRVVRVRLFKFMARVPLAAMIVLLVYVLILRIGPVLGLPVETVLAITIIATVILVEWALHAFKRPLERLFQLTDEPEVRRIQELGERILTTRDMHQFLDSVLAATCEVLRTPTAFLAVFTESGPKLEVVVGPLEESDEELAEEDWRQLSETSANNGGSRSLPTSDNFLLWQNYWIRPLHSHDDVTLLGILGIRARAALPDLSEAEEEAFEHLADQAASALEDRILQQMVFSAVEGLLPQVTDLQRRRSLAAFGGAPLLSESASRSAVTQDPEFNSMVWDALSHYWGGPKLTKSPLMNLNIVQRAMDSHGGNPTQALREILTKAVEQQRPEGERSLTTAEWILYNILELKFIQGRRVRDVARRLAMSESDLYRKQRVAIENVARTVSVMEEEAVAERERQATE